MKNSISIFSLLLLMGALITTSGCNLKDQLDDLVGSIPGIDYLNVSSTPSSLVSSGNLVNEIRGTGYTRSPGFEITSVSSNKYVNVALVRVTSFVYLAYLNSVESTNLTTSIPQADPNPTYGAWSVLLTSSPDTTYYIYIWTTKEPYTASNPPTLSTTTDPSQIYDDLTKGKTVLGLAASGENKYYATGK